MYLNFLYNRTNTATYFLMPVSLRSYSRTCLQIYSYTRFLFYLSLICEITWLSKSKITRTEIHSLSNSTTSFYLFPHSSLHPSPTPLRTLSKTTYHTFTILSLRNSSTKVYICMRTRTFQSKTLVSILVSLFKTQRFVSIHSSCQHSCLMEHVCKKLAITLSKYHMLGIIWDEIDSMH